MTKDFFNMMFAFVSVLAFCLVIVFTIGFVKVNTLDRDTNTQTVLSEEQNNINSASVINFKMDKELDDGGQKDGKYIPVLE